MYRYLSGFIIRIMLVLGGIFFLIPLNFYVLRAATPHIPIAGGLKGKSCYECHLQDREMSTRKSRYSITKAYNSFMRSPHGRLRKLGSKRAPYCEDCHATREWSKILPVSHPDSPMHPDRLGVICAGCHGPEMLSGKAAEGTMHYPEGGMSLFIDDSQGARLAFLPGRSLRESHYEFAGMNMVQLAETFFKALAIGVLLMFGIYIIIDQIRSLIRENNSEG